MQRVAPCFVLAAILAGCSKRPAPDEPGVKIEAADPTAAYTLAFKDIVKGDSFDVMKDRDATATITVKNVNTTTKLKDRYRFEYAETILDTSPDDPRPTKVSRAYKTAEKADQNGRMEKRSYVGKTVTIERFMKGYKYVVGTGQSLPAAEQIEMNQDFTTASWKLNQNFPNKPVKVGDTWDVDFAAITAIASNPVGKYDKDRSKITGKLAKVYEKDGRRWGVVELKIVMVIDTFATNGSPIKGDVNTETTFDIVIDGSLRAGTMKMKLSSTIDDRDVTGNERRTTVAGTEERSISPTK